MICNECGVENKEGNSFCANCGEPMHGNGEHEVKDNGIICGQCGYCNSPEDNYCTECGSPLKESSNESQKEPKQLNVRDRKASSKKNSGNEKLPINNKKSASNWEIIKSIGRIKLLWITLAVVLGSIFTVTILDLIANASTGDKTPVNEIKSKNPAVESEVIKIASKFICSCGECGGESLELCKCDYAVQERKMIRDYKEQSLPEETIITELNKKYGGLKKNSETTANMTGGKSSLVGSASLVVNSPVNAEKILNIKNVTPEDKLYIYSQFNCPCGRCGVDELKDCTCSHPKGAKEVKQFIDDKIALNSYSAAKIIKEVEKKYGARKS